MKFRTTKKNIMKSYKCLSIGYCELQSLLNYENPVAYTAGVNGWNADIYAFGGIAIVTGYNPFGYHVDHELTRRYENKAMEILNRPYSAGTHDDRRAELSKLLHEFINVAIN